MTRSGHCNPGFKEAPHASEGVFSGIVSRPGVYRASHTMRRHRHVGVIGGVRKRFDACVGGGARAIRGLVRFGYPPKPGHFVSSITYREGLRALPRPGQLIDV